MTASAPSKRHLYVVLDEDSKRKVASHAQLPVVRSDHVTLAQDVAPDATLVSFLNFPCQVGDELTLRAVEEHLSEHVQAWVVELNGSSHRQQDGGTLHVTVSRSESSRSRDSNELLRAGGPARPLSVVLRGTLQWVHPR